MPTITKEIVCPGCSTDEEDTLIEVDIDPANPEDEVECPECGEVVPFKYDAKTGIVTVEEYEDEAEDDEDAEEEEEEEDEDEEDV